RRRGSLTSVVHAFVGNFRAATASISRQCSAAQRESPGSGGAGLNLGMGTIRRKFRPGYRHEYVRRVVSNQGTAKNAGIRAGPGCRGRQGAGKPEQRVMKETGRRVLSLSGARYRGFMIDRP